MDLRSRRDLHRLAAGFASAVQRADARCVLVTSVSGRDGVGRVVPGLEYALSGHREQPYRFVRWGWLRQMDPTRSNPDEVLVVLGPPMMEGGEFLDLPRAWVEAFDGAVLVVGRRATRRDELEEVSRWLRAAGIPPLGVVLNASVTPADAFGATLGGLLERVRARWRRPAGDARTPGAGP